MLYRRATSHYPFFSFSTQSIAANILSSDQSLRFGAVAIGTGIDKSVLIDVEHYYKVL